MSDAAAVPPSFWLSSLEETLEPRAALQDDQSADVAIVGAGYTGLWTAYYLVTQNPNLRVAVVESQYAGFGAAGRNGGWCSLHLAGVDAWLRGSQREQAVALQRAMFDAVDEVGRVAAAEGIDCDYAKGGFLTVATNDAECERVQPLVAEMHAHGFSDEDFRWLDATECTQRVRMEGALGGLYSPHCAAVQPAKLARGLAHAVERHGVVIYEQSPARALEPGVVVTDRGRLHARVVLRCTEAYTRRLAGEQRRLLPLHSMMIATEPLSEATWKDIGAEDRMVFGDVRRILSYAQRTADGRIAIGAGGRYDYDSGIVDTFSPERDFAAAQAALGEFFPALRGVRITHRWGGAFGVPRDWKPFVRFDEPTGLGTAGGYVGNGVAASNLAGRTLADLVESRSSERTRYPWVQHRSPDWEPEPLRWLAVNGILKLGAAADRAEQRGRTARLSAAIFAMAGH